jgi:hypothetical protein
VWEHAAAPQPRLTPASARSPSRRVFEHPMAAAGAFMKSLVAEPDRRERPTRTRHRSGHVQTGRISRSGRSSSSSPRRRTRRAPGSHHGIQASGRMNAGPTAGPALRCHCASPGRRELSRQVGARQGLRSSSADLLDETVLNVNGKGKAQVYDPRRTLAGTLTPALTWGLFGLLSGG